MRVFTVRIQLPEGMHDEMAYQLLADRLATLLKATAEGRLAYRSREAAAHAPPGFRLCPEGTAIQASSLEDGVLFQIGAFRQPRPDAESAAEEKGNGHREGDR